jgi:hypothetical protein
MRFRRAIPTWLSLPLLAFAPEALGVTQRLPIERALRATEAQDANGPAIRARLHRILDRLQGKGPFVPARSAEEARVLLASLGIRDLANHDLARLNLILEEVRKVPGSVLRLIQRAGSGLDLVSGFITEHPEFEDLKGVRVEKYREYRTYDQVPGIASRAASVVGVRTLQGQGRLKVAIHELAHSFEFALAELGLTEGRVSESAAYKEGHLKSRWNNYYFDDYAEEAFAETFTLYFHSPETRAQARAQHPALVARLEELLAIAEKSPRSARPATRAEGSAAARWARQLSRAGHLVEARLLKLHPDAFEQVPETTGPGNFAFVLANPLVAARPSEGARKVYRGHNGRIAPERGETLIVLKPEHPRAEEIRAAIRAAEPVATAAAQLSRFGRAELRHFLELSSEEGKLEEFSWPMSSDTSWKMRYSLPGWVAFKRGDWMRAGHARMIENRGGYRVLELMDEAGIKTEIVPRNGDKLWLTKQLPPAPSGEPLLEKLLRNPAHPADSPVARVIRLHGPNLRAITRAWARPDDVAREANRNHHLLVVAPNGSAHVVRGGSVGEGKLSASRDGERYSYDLREWSTVYVIPDVAPPSIAPGHVRMEPKELFRRARTGDHIRFFQRADSPLTPLKEISGTVYRPFDVRDGLARRLELIEDGTGKEINLEHGWGLDVTGELRKGDLPWEFFEVMVGGGGFYPDPSPEAARLHRYVQEHGRVYALVETLAKRYGSVRHDGVIEAVPDQPGVFKYRDKDGAEATFDLNQTIRFHISVTHEIERGREAFP